MLFPAGKSTQNIPGDFLSEKFVFDEPNHPFRGASAEDLPLTFDDTRHHPAAVFTVDQILWRAFGKYHVEQSSARGGGPRQ